MRPSTLLLASLLVLNISCKSEEAKPVSSVQTPESKPTIVPLPPAPNGAPLSAEFLGFTEGATRYIHTRLFNTGDKLATSYVILARFFDADGNLIPVRQGTASERPSTFMSYTGSSYNIEPANERRIVMESVDVPLSADRAEVIVSRVDTVQNNKPIGWFSQPRWGQWPKQTGGSGD